MKRGFTLAEVLVTLGVVGIVAAMTLPSLVNKYQSKVLETGLKKSYANLQNAYIMTKANLGVSNLREAYTTVYNNDGVLPYKDEFEKEFKRNIKTVKKGKP